MAVCKDMYIPLFKLVKFSVLKSEQWVLRLAHRC